MIARFVAAICTFSIVLTGQELEAPDALAEAIRQQRWPEVLAVAGKLQAADPNNPVPRAWAGIALLKQQDHVRAVIALRSAEKLGLDNPTLHKSLGLAYFGLRQHQLFLKKMADANHANNRDAEPYYHLGRYYAQVMNDFEKALKLFDLALERNPGEYTSLQFRGVCLQALHREAEAKAAFLEVIRTVETRGLRYGWPYQRLAELLLAKSQDGEIETALRYARRAVELDPGNDTGHATLAKTLEKLEQWEEALAERQEAARLNPSEASHRYLLSRLYRRLGNAVKAGEELKIYEKLRVIYGIR